MKILLACERSGGHIFPAITFAKKIEKDLLAKGLKPKIYFFATSYFLKGYIEKEGFIVLGRSFTLRNLFTESIWRFFEALFILFWLRPDKVIGFGGRDSFFLVLLSSCFFLDTAIYEPNLSFGQANKILSLFVKKIFRGFKASKGKTIGIPLRKNIKKIEKIKAREILGFDRNPVILCFGGTQGSFFINKIFQQFVQSSKINYQIIHITGRKSFHEISEFYDKIKNNKFIKDFYYDMELLYSASDIVIGRSGAVTLGELTYYKLPSILIPHPQAYAHQKENAFYLADRKASFVCLQDGFSFDEFKEKLESLLSDDKLRKEISNNLKDINLGVSFEDFCKNIYL